MENSQKSIKNCAEKDDLFRSRMAIADKYKRISDLPLKTQFSLRNQVINITNTKKEDLNKLFFEVLVQLKLKELTIKDLIKEGIY